MTPYSVLMSVYHKEKPAFFREAIDSMLQQTVRPAEIVLVCDGKLTPELDAVIAEKCDAYPELFHVIRLSENRGLGIALDVGLRACKHSLVARMDTDDIALPDRIEQQLKAFDKDPLLGAVGGQIAEFEGTTEHIIGYRNVPLSPEAVGHRLKKRNPMNHMTVLLRKDAVLAAGSYQDLPLYEDYYLWARMVADGQRLCNIPQICCYVRVDEGLYQRRGGKQYFKNAMRLEKKLLSLKLINLPEYFINAGIRLTCTVLLPGKLRKQVYCKCLRKNRQKDNK